jgi:SAM-dependent methyltransferase
MPMKLLLLLAIALASSSDVVAFVSPPPFSAAATTTRRSATNSDESATSSSSSSFVDPLTYLRTEWVSASLVSNQTPKEADRILQLGTEDGRLVNFVPRTVREIITSSAEKKDGPEGGGLTVSCERQLRQMAERRRSGATIVYSNQPADDLRETPSSSVDVVVSLLAARRMKDNGLDWRQAVREAGRVLKPGGRFLFVEGETIDGESYLDFVVGLSERGGVEIKGGLEKLAADEGGGDGGSDDDDDEEEEDEEERWDTIWWTWCCSLTSPGWRSRRRTPTSPLPRRNGGRHRRRAIESRI